MPSNWAAFGLTKVLRLTKYPAMVVGEIKDATGEISKPAGSKPVEMRAPDGEDGPQIHRLIANCPPLDGNSLYANLLQATHFSETCVVAEHEGAVVGWVSGYVRPDAQDHYFLWQVAVDASMRGQNLAKRMIRHILERKHLSHVRYMNTTITPDNAASWRLFRSVAEELGAEFQDRPHFLEATHFAGQHATEHMVTIGPFSCADARR